MQMRGGERWNPWLDQRLRTLAGQRFAFGDPRTRVPHWRAVLRDPIANNPRFSVIAETDDYVVADKACRR